MEKKVSSTLHVNRKAIFSILMNGDNIDFPTIPSVGPRGENPYGNVRGWNK